MSSYTSSFPLHTLGSCFFTLLSLFIVSTVLYNHIFPTSHLLLSSHHDHNSWGNLFLNLSVGTPWGLRWPFPGPINCSTLHEVRNLEFLASGRTKAVYKGVFRGSPVAVKTVNLDGPDLRGCQGRTTSCYRSTAAKLIKELILLSELENETFIKILGSCVPDVVGPVMIVTELGVPLDTLKLLQLSWNERLQLIHGMARLLYHLAHSPLGSLGLTDLRPRQFVMVGGVLKLADLDNIVLNEPVCEKDTDCERVLQTNVIDRSVSCVGSRCRGYNERLNVWRAGQHFVHQLLPLTFPSLLEPQIQQLTEAFRGSWSSSQLLKVTEKLVTSGHAEKTNITFKNAFGEPEDQLADHVLLKPR